jgi:UDP-galactopyranose mutase
LKVERARPTRRGADALFRSFWLASFDAVDHLPGIRLPGDGFDLGEYAARVDADYATVAEAGITCVRESIGWRRAARDGSLDFASVLLRAERARRAGLQIVWTLCHDGWPDDIDVCSDAFVDRFRAFAGAAARVLAPFAGPEPPLYTPINEISFLAWALAETALVGRQRSDLRNRSYELKRQLVRAALAASDAIREVDSRARFLHTEPATSVVASDEGPTRHAVLFRGFDMLTGRLEPALGGAPGEVDVIGIQCHSDGHAWRGTPDGASRTPAAPPMALSRLLEDVYARYRRPIVVAESNPVPASRAGWLREIGDEIGKALERGVPIVATCVSRVVERPGWEDPRYWRGRRLWDALLHATHHAPRVRNSAYEQALRDVRSRIDPLVGSSLHGHPS